MHLMPEKRMQITYIYVQFVANIANNVFPNTSHHKIKQKVLGVLQKYIKNADFIYLYRVTPK